MMITLRYLIDRARYILKTEGLPSLLIKGFRFLVGRFFRYETCYLYEGILEDSRNENEADFKPKMDNFTLMIVSTNQEADRLEAEGFEFPSSTNNLRQLLDKGTVAFCTFVGKELAHIGWYVMSKQAMDTLDIGLKVDFSNNEVLAGPALINPKYRRLGFHRYSAFRNRQFLLSQGKTVFRFYTSKSNIVAQDLFGKVSSKYGEGRSLRILWWKFWKETPLTRTGYD